MNLSIRGENGGKWWSQDFSIIKEIIISLYYTNHLEKPGDLWSNKNEMILTPNYGKNATIIRDVMKKKHGRLELVVEGSLQCSGIWC
jgi:hypothetical protein